MSFPPSLTALSKKSSTQWTAHQRRDCYIKQRAFSASHLAFKLLELDIQLNFLDHEDVNVVIDLSVVPGGWSQVISWWAFGVWVRGGQMEEEIARSESKGRGAIVAVDLLPMNPIPGIWSLQKDFLDPKTDAAITNLLHSSIPGLRWRKMGKALVDVVLSDMAQISLGMICMTLRNHISFVWQCKHLRTEEQIGRWYEGVLVPQTEYQMFSGLLHKMNVPHLGVLAPSTGRELHAGFQVLLSRMSSMASFSSYSFTACTTVILYDVFLYLPTEIDNVWLPRPVHPLLLLFALNRYLPLVYVVMTINWLLHKPTCAQCHQFAFVVSPLMALGVFTSQVVLMICTYAIWDRHRAVFWCFIGLGVFCFIPGVVCLAIELKTVQFIELPFDLPGCLSISPTTAEVFFVPVLISEMVIASLTLFKGIQHLRHSSHPFLIEFYISGMFFYACLFLITLANILAPTWANTPFLDYVQLILHSILSSRIMLLIVKQRRIHQCYLDEEPYTGDIELSAKNHQKIPAQSNEMFAPDGPRNDLKNMPV
ncbi:FtsJ-like methyltransferase-domain-containing protein [Desarmillaria tabescens]|uniref:rRNA methyltransferase 2, mitochondrial n=1 Tax=Armillaria tabescens TaxID=1929756 RepID=A0AA39KHN1_ARMTA|nr:FtsJ-like methyltransferase-domain-containing protein [Desarmillaria tabescens]KAK0460151.1 FtsJ-like methyltransferase-domain-containing protein [Desarmillaria tabescens]